MKKDIREGLDEIVEINREKTLRKLYGITEDDEQYKIEKEPKSFDDYLQRVRRIGGVLAVIDPWSGIPRFVLSYEKDGIKLYPNFSKYLSRFFAFLRMLILKNTRTYYIKVRYHRIIMESLRKIRWMRSYYRNIL